MEEIYLNLVSVEEVSLFLKGLRRKLDVTRNVNERTRAEITTEFNREKLRHKLSELEDKLEIK
jgi:predicted translin family RNA/ssDNA-binding protein